jgi:F-type H+-transporting ATPase subunit b
MIDLDYSLFAQLIGYLILLVILNAILYKPIRRLLAERASRMSAIQSDAEKYERNAEQLLKDFDMKLAEARASGQGAMEKLKQEAREEEHQLSEASNKEADARKQELMAELTSEIDAARKDLTAKVEAFAMDISQKLLGRAI